MSLIYITGAPDTGKTTIQKELTRLEYEAYDLDDSRLGGPHNKVTGELVVIPPADQREPDWFEDHEWRIYPEPIRGLKRQGADKDIFICGVSGGDSNIISLFDKVIYLKLSNESLETRLKSRRDNDYGKNDFEIEEILKRKLALDERYQSENSISIDASRPLADVVAEITTLLATDPTQTRQF